MFDNHIRQECNEYLCKFFNTMNEGLVLMEIIQDNNGTALDFKITEVNSAFEEIIGLKREKAIGSTLLQIFPNAEKHWINLLEQAALTCGSYKLENYFAELKRYFKIVAFSNKVGQCAVFFIDITEIRRANEILKKYQLLSENTSEIMLFTNSNGDIIDANAAAVSIYGYSYNELTKMNLKSLKHQNRIEKLKEQVDKVLTQGEKYESVHVRKDGTEFPVEVSLKGAMVEDAMIIMVIVRDISERKKIEKRLLHKAEHDPLTDIPNRRSLYRYLRKLLSDAAKEKFQVAVLYFDIDKFKQINDSYGHEAGDVVIKEVVKRVKNVIRKEDFLARVGGDEFIIIQPFIRSAKDVVKLAERINNKMISPIKYGKYSTSVSASIGVSIYPQDTNDLKSLIKCADLAMYAVKNSGGNFYGFYENSDN